MTEIISENKVPREGVCEGMVELENLKKTVSFDDVQVAVGKRSNVCRRLDDGRLLPELVSEHVALT